MTTNLAATTDLFQKDAQALKRFRRGLRREDQEIFDELWSYIDRHILACANADHLLPIEVFLLVIILETHKEQNRLRVLIQDLRAKIRNGGINEEHARQGASPFGGIPIWGHPHLRHISQEMQ